MKKLHVILLLILVLTLGILGGIYIGKSSKTNLITKQEYISKSSEINGVDKQEIFENNLKCQEQFKENQEDFMEKGMSDVVVFYSTLKNECWVSYQKFYVEEYNYPWKCNVDLYVSRPLFDKTRDGDYIMYSYSSCFKENQSISAAIFDVAHSLLGRECVDILNIGEDKYDGIETYSNKDKCKFSNIKVAFLEELEYLKGN